MKSLSNAPSAPSPLSEGLNEVLATLSTYRTTEAAMRVRALGEIASALETERLIELAAMISDGEPPLQAA